MNLVMADSIKTTEGVRLTVAIPHPDYERLVALKARIRRVRGKALTTQDLASEWVTRGIAEMEATIAAEDQAKSTA